jgi:hypothetical protein
MLRKFAYSFDYSELKFSASCDYSAIAKSVETGRLVLDRHDEPIVSYAFSLTHIARTRFGG